MDSDPGRDRLHGVHREQRAGILRDKETNMDKLSTEIIELIAAAEAWREVMVRSNGPYPEDDPNGHVHWSKVKNFNGRLVMAVDAVTTIRKSR
jgi:hypothetical protein